MNNEKKVPNSVQIDARFFKEAEVWVVLLAICVIHPARERQRMRGKCVSARVTPLAGLFPP